MENWSVEAWIKEYKTSKGCPFGSRERFQTKLEAEEKAREWSKNPAVRLVRILDRDTGRFYRLGHRDPDGTVQPWWIIFSPSNNAYVGRAYPTKERAAKALDAMLREGNIAPDACVVASPDGWIHTTRAPDETIAAWERRLKEEGIE